jgi:hypothetical protein
LFLQNDRNYSIIFRRENTLTYGILVAPSVAIFMSNWITCADVLVYIKQTRNLECSLGFYSCLKKFSYVL